MKKNILLIVACLICVNTYSQTDFTWEKTDSIPKSKDQIYSDSKVYVTDTWKSAQNVVQNDDKEAGIIMIKSVSIQRASHMGNRFVYTYSYSVNIKMKDNRYKITLDKVYCESAYIEGAKGNIEPIEPFDGDNAPKTGNGSYFGLSKPKCIKMMESLRSELQKIVDNYELKIKTPSETEW